jgi:hypothetical protein
LAAHQGSGAAARAPRRSCCARDLDVPIYDHLVEITFSIMARARAKDPSAGWAVDFVSGAMAPSLPAIAGRAIEAIATAGGMPPAACPDALRADAVRQGIALRVAVAEGG